MPVWEGVAACRGSCAGMADLEQDPEVLDVGFGRGGKDSALDCVESAVELGVRDRVQEERLVYCGVPLLSLS